MQVGTFCLLLWQCFAKLQCSNVFTLFFCNFFLANSTKTPKQDNTQPKRTTNKEKQTKEKGEKKRKEKKVGNLKDG
jgi:hypothetical protein